MKSVLATEIGGCGGQPVLVLRGDIDLATAPQFEAACSRLAAFTDRLILDLGGVEFMDSSGLSVLVIANNKPLCQQMHPSPGAAGRHTLWLAGWIRRAMRPSTLFATIELKVSLGPSPNTYESVQHHGVASTR